MHDYLSVVIRRCFNECVECRQGGFKVMNFMPLRETAPTTGWSVMFETLEEWEEFTDSFQRVKLKDVRLLHSNLTDLLPHIEYLSQVREKDDKKKLVAALPRRTSDRIATKAAEKEEMVGVVFITEMIFRSLLFVNTQ